MKTIIIFILIGLSFAFVPERLYKYPEDNGIFTPIPEIVEQENTEQKFEKPRLQRQNAIRFPLSDSEASTDSTDSDTNEIDSFQADKSYFYGMNTSFTDLYEEWQQEDKEKKVLGEDLIKESFEKAEMVFEDAFDTALETLTQLSQEAEEYQTLFGMDKSAYKKSFKLMKTNFDEIFDQAVLGLSLMTGQPNPIKSLLGVDKESIKEIFNEMDGNLDEVFDETLSSFIQLSKESAEEKSLFGLDKETIKQLFNVAEANFGQILSQTCELPIFSKDAKDIVSTSESSTDETDADSTYTNQSDSPKDSFDEIEANLDEVLLAVRQLFDESVEAKALYGSEQNTKLNSEESDSFQVDQTYFQGLGYNLAIPSKYLANDSGENSEFNFDMLLAGLGGLVKDAIEKEGLLNSDKSDE